MACTLIEGGLFIWSLDKNHFDNCEHSGCVIQSEVSEQSHHDCYVLVTVPSHLCSLTVGRHPGVALFTNEDSSPLISPLPLSKWHGVSDFSGITADLLLCERRSRPYVYKSESINQLKQFCYTARLFSHIPLKGNK